MNDPEIEIDEGSSMGLNNTFYQVEIGEFVVNFRLTFGFHEEVIVVTNATQRPRSADILATAIKRREIDETNVIFGRLA
jgi:hypothetical protein